MSEAKLEAEKVISNFRSDLEAKYQASHSEINKNTGANGDALNFQTVSDIDEMKKVFTGKKTTIEDAIVDAVCKVAIKERQ